MNIDLYEMTYSNHKRFGNKKPDTNIKITKETYQSVMNIIMELEHIEPKDKDEIIFSDVICNILPVFDEKTHNLSYRNNFMFVDGNKEGNPNENAERFKKLDINTLPLIEVAKYLNIQVEKSNLLELYGEFDSIENKIILGSDYILTFLHELAHAVDRILGRTYIDELMPKYSEYIGTKYLDEELYYECYERIIELVAELSAVVLCKKYNIFIDLSYSKYYLGLHWSSVIDINYIEIIKRVALICEYVNKCVENIWEKQRL